MLFTSLSKYLLVLATAIPATLAMAFDIWYLVHYRSPTGALLRVNRRRQIADRDMQFVVDRMGVWSLGQCQARFLEETEGEGVAVTYTRVAGSRRQAEDLSMYMERLVTQYTRYN